MSQKLTTLEAPVAFSASSLWQLQRSFYETKGESAWAGGFMPYQITSNPFIAETYARLIEGFLSDLPKRRAGDPLCILELGAGHGIFSHALLTELERNGQLSEDLLYIMSDGALSNVEAWKRNERIRPFAEKGNLHYIQHLVGVPDFGALERCLRGRTGPLVLIANYILDSVPQDFYVIEHGELQELYVSLEAAGSIPADLDQAQEDLLPQLHLKYSRVPVPHDRYPEPLLNRILHEYQSTLPAVTLPFPAPALQMFAGLENIFADQPMLLLSADKGLVNELDLVEAQGPPAIELHAGNSFSLTVNYDAIGRYFRLRDGTAMLPPPGVRSLAVCAFARGGGDPFRKLAQAYARTVGTFSPDDLYQASSLLASQYRPEPSQVLALLRLTRHDAAMLLHLEEAILAGRDNLTEQDRIALREAILETWKRSFPLSPPAEDLAFRMGTLLLQLRFHTDALALLEESRRTSGDSAAALFNIGLCYTALEQYSLAAQAMQTACAIDPALGQARTQLIWLDSLQNRLAETSNSSGIRTL